MQLRYNDCIFDATLEKADAFSDVLKSARVYDKMKTLCVFIGRNFVSPDAVESTTGDMIKQ